MGLSRRRIIIMGSMLSSSIVVGSLGAYKLLSKPKRNLRNLFAEPDDVERFGRLAACNEVDGENVRQAFDFLSNGKSTNARIVTEIFRQEIQKDVSASRSVMNGSWFVTSAESEISELLAMEDLKQGEQLC